MALIHLPSQIRGFRVACSLPLYSYIRRSAEPPALILPYNLMSFNFKFNTALLLYALTGGSIIRVVELFASVLSDGGVPGVTAQPPAGAHSSFLFPFLSCHFKLPPSSIFSCMTSRSIFSASLYYVRRRAKPTTLMNLPSHRWLRVASSLATILSQMSS